jgi:hypothetical protein
MLQLAPAIALYGVEHIAGQALRMESDKGRTAGVDNTLGQSNYLLTGGMVSEAYYPEKTKFGRKIGLSDTFYAGTWG